MNSGDRKTYESERRVEEILSAMTFEEKARMPAGKDAWHLWGNERLGVPSIEVADCGHGVTIAHERPSPATCFPTSVGMASSWDEYLLTEVGKALGRECRALGISVLLGPMVNLHRLPVGGRNYETFSEDPVLAGKLAAALVRGVQSVGTGACVKAATANNQQKYQFTSSAEVDERTLRELYLRPFEIAVREAAPCAIMTSYNKLNGEDTAASRYLIRTVIKGELAFKGFVVSDWRGVHDERSIDAGLDLEMPGPAKHMTAEAIRNAISSGRMTETDFDDRVRRLLRAAVEYGEPRVGAESGLDTKEHRELARKVAEESIVLLRNRNGLLPLSGDRIRTLAVVGPNAAHARLGGGGSASVQPFYAISPLDGIKAHAAGKIEILYAEGRSLSGDDTAAAGPFRYDRPDGSIGDGLYAEYWEDSASLERDEAPAATGTADRIDFSWGWASPAPGIPRSGYAVRYSGGFVPGESGDGTVSLSFQHGGARLYVNDILEIDAWSPEDPAMFEASYRAKTERANLKVSEGTPIRLRVEYRKLAPRAALRLSWRLPGSLDPVEEAVALAERADAVIVCTGLSNMFEGGTMDRESYALPEGQDELIERIAGANRNTIVALQNGTPVAMPWLEKTGAVLECWYPGQEGGSALARILFGDVNPSGKLPDTFPVRLEDLEAMKYYPGDEKTMRYGEGLFVGYRDLLSKGIAPLFPFGFGLSYTVFEYGRLVLSSRELSGPSTVLEAVVAVRNAGTRRGRETVQLYLHASESGTERPAWTLIAFKKVGIDPGETATVAFEVTAGDLAVWSEGTHAWTSVPGEYELRAGPNCSEGSSERFAYRNI